jgi:GntR family transcriptional regulator
MAVSVTPRYVEARDTVERQLRGTGLTPGDRLPPERELAATLGISRPTLRRALEQLEAAGRIERRQGSGTYLAEPRVELDVRVLVSFARGILGGSLVPGTRLVASERIPADRAVAHRLGVARGEPVVRLARLRTADGLPVVLECSWVPESVAPGLERVELDSHPLHELLSERYGVRVRHAEQELVPGFAELPADAPLGCRAGTPLMIVRRRTFDDADATVEISEDRYLSGRARFRSDAFVP